MQLAATPPAASVGREPLGFRLISRAELFYDLPAGVLRNNSRRNGNISKARWAVSYVLLKEAGWSYPRIGKLLSQDHKAPQYGCRQALKLLRSDPLFFEVVRQLMEEVSPHHVGDQSI